MSDMSMMQEFKTFALKGNVMDLAVGCHHRRRVRQDRRFLVQGHHHAGGRQDFRRPRFCQPLLSLNGQAAELTLAEAKKAGAVLAYGNFITIALNFVILAFVIFQMVRIINKLRGEVPPAPAADPENTVLLREIRDSLKK
jgi:Large-conductance mechanosensitive channel